MNDLCSKLKCLGGVYIALKKKVNDPATLAGEGLSSQ